MCVRWETIAFGTCARDLAVLFSGNGSGAGKKIDSKIIFLRLRIIPEPNSSPRGSAAPLEFRERESRHSHELLDELVARDRSAQPPRRPSRRGAPARPRAHPSVSMMSAAAAAAPLASRRRSGTQHVLYARRAGVHSSSIVRCAAVTDATAVVSAVAAASSVCSITLLSEHVELTLSHLLDVEEVIDLILVFDALEVHCRPRRRGVAAPSRAAVAAFSPGAARGCVSPLAHVCARCLPAHAGHGIVIPAASASPAASAACRRLSDLYSACIFLPAPMPR